MDILKALFSKSYYGSRLKESLSAKLNGEICMEKVRIK